MEALNSSEPSADGNAPRIKEVVLERWKIELKCLPNDYPSEDFGSTLPTIYKRSIVFFRSLFVATHLMPAWKFSQQSLSKGLHSALEVKCRVAAAEAPASGLDSLRQPLVDGREAVTDYMFGDLEVPVGRFYASVTYRNDCNFRVDDSESLLSSRFMGADEQFFRPTYHEGRRESTAEVVGSLPSRRHSRNLSEMQQQQTYGSLSTFHGAGPLGTSPISALKAVRPIGSDTSSPPESVPASVEPEPPHSLPIIGRPASARPSLRGAEAGRRPSVSFQPFKAGSLSGSPRVHDDAPPSPQSTSSRQAASSALAQTRNRNSLTAGMAASLRGAPPQPEPAQSSSPKPTTGRYSSSFTHRRGRPSFGGASRGDDDQGSSGKQSLSSSVAQPGSGLLAEAGGASSGSFQADDDNNLSEFLKVLESKKTLQSFERSKQGGPSTKKTVTVTQLSKFQMMKDSNVALTESMNSSVQLQRSSSSSSRQLTSVPGMVNPASMSASSSPSKPLSPHTPHTPAIPSRLSENSIIDHQAQAQVPATRTRATPGIDATEEGIEDTPVSQEGTTAIDIPLSPRLMQPGRRSSSVAQQSRAVVEDDDADLAYGGGQRSVSLGADEQRDPPGLIPRARTEPDPEANPGLRPAADIRAINRPRSSSSAERDGKVPPRGLLSTTSASYRHQRHRADRQGVGGSSPPQSSPLGSAGPSAPRYGASSARGGGDGEADDEPLVFVLSEIGQQQQNRRSLEEGRGGRGGGSGYSDRAAFDSSRGSRRRWQ